MTSYAQVNPEVLSWARERAGLSVDTAARRLNTTPERIALWEAGEAKPTFRQAQIFADKTFVPFGFLFLPKPPQEKLPIPDLRTVGNAAVHEPSLELLDTIRSVLQKQAWYKEYVRDQGGAELPFVGRYSVRSRVAEVVTDIRETLNVAALDPERLRWEEYQRALIRASEDAGILIMRAGIVGNNTRRPLDVGEFRGFAISDRWAPVIFINTRDAPAARLFTLVHELAHIWIGSSGISSAGVLEGRREEQYCNSVASEFLVPADLLEGSWEDHDDWQDNLPVISRKFHVSQLVVARRALELGKISRDEYDTYYRRELDRFRNFDGGGGSFYRNATVKNSEKLSRAVIAEAFSGRMLLRDAGRLLGVAPAKIQKYAKALDA